MIRQDGFGPHRKRCIDWLQVLREYDVRFLALDVQADSDLLQLFRRHPEWIVDTEDGATILLARDPANLAGHNQTGIPGTAGLAA
jgi:hypothetical protein